MSMKPKVCFVVQRYGLEVNGGAELHCRLIAERVLPYCKELTVLTSKAVDYTTWADEYSQDAEEINGVRVQRFSVEHPRDNQFIEINHALEMQGYYNAGPEREQTWIDEQGPYMPELLTYIEQHRDEYDIFVFFTYLYYQTVMGIPIVRDKAIMVPDAHDEPFLRMQVFENLFHMPQAFFFNTYGEARLVHKKFYNHYIPYEIGGAGVEVPTHVDADAFKKKYQLDNYIIYVGRIDVGKNCPQLFADFIAYKEKYSSDLKLVLMGKEVVQIPKHEDIISLGFVSEEDKFNGIAGAKLLVLPSMFESLSIVVLEAFSLGIPVLVNGICEVLRAHCIKSNGGLYYGNTVEFEDMLSYMLSHETLLKKMGQCGRHYVDENYQWDAIAAKLMRLINRSMNR